MTNVKWYIRDQLVATWAKCDVDRIKGEPNFPVKVQGTLNGKKVQEDSDWEWASAT